MVPLTARKRKLIAQALHHVDPYYDRRESLILGAGLTIDSPWRILREQRNERMRDEIFLSIKLRNRSLEVYQMCIAVGKNGWRNLKRDSHLFQQAISSNSCLL